MRIWHADIGRGPLRVDGIASAVGRLASAQAGAGHEVTVLAAASPSPAPTLDLHAPQALSAPTGMSLLAVARHELRRAVPEVVHLHGAFRPGHAALALGLRRAGVAYVVSPHSGLAEPALGRSRGRKAAYLRLVEGHLLRKAALVCCLTDQERHDVHRRTGDGVHTTVLPNPVDPVVLDGTAWRPPGTPPTVVTLARFDVRQKGLDVLAEVAARCPEVRFVVHGEQDRNEPHRTEALRRSCPPNLTLAPAVFGADKVQALAGAHIYAQPSRWEGLSLSLLEAMAVGVPCAVSPYVAATLPQAQPCVVLDPEPGRAAAQLRAALADPERLEPLRRAGQAYARSLHPAPLAARYVERYAEAVGIALPAAEVIRA